VLAKNDDALGASQSPAAHSFPCAREQTTPHDVAAYGHIWIEIPDVVSAGFSLQHGDESSNDSLEWRVGHGHDCVTIKEKGARNGEPNIAQVIYQALFHIEARKRSRTGPDASNEAGASRLITAPLETLCRIVRRAPAK